MGPDHLVFLVPIVAIVSGIGASVIKRLFVTDTIEVRIDPYPDNISVITVAPLFAKAIRSVHDRTSVSNLFPEKPIAKK